MISRANEKDIKKIKELIEQEFSYTNFTNEKLMEKTKNQEVYIFKKTKNRKLIGFIEFELKGEEVMINALSVKKEFRKNGYGKELLTFAVDLINEFPVKKINLLVKKENTIAKELYKKSGFVFDRNHVKEIDGAKVEQWSTFIEEKNDYLN